MAPSAEGAVSRRLTEDKPSASADAASLRTVAAALSAAVTTAKRQGIAPTSQAEPTKKKRTPPNASRSSGERGLGGEVLLSEKQPLPPASPGILPRLFGREREGGDFSTEKSPPSQHSLIHHSPVVWVCFVGGFGGFGEGLLGRHVGNAGCAAGNRGLKRTNRLGGRRTVAAVYAGRVQ